MHFGCVCDNGASHVMCAAAIGRALEKRGHRFTLFGLPHLAQWIQKEGISCSYFPHSPFLAQRLESGGKGVTNSPRESINSKVREVERLLRDLSSKLEGSDINCSDINCMLVDANLFAGGSVAEAFSLPFATFHCALPPHSEPAIAPIFLPWGFQRSILGRLRNRTAHRVLRYLARPIVEELNRFRKRRGLPLYGDLADTFSPFAEVTQMVREFDFPRTQLPSTVHYVGPYTRQRKDDVPFPFDKLDGRSLVYASLGTIFGSKSDLWNSIAEACAPLDVQLVITLGAREQADSLNALPGHPIVVPYAPQQALLSRAGIFITHAGLNSTLESLDLGVPMLAMPFMWDQIGIASRIAFHRVGLSLKPQQRRPEVLAESIRRLLTDSLYRDRCKALSSIIQKTGGAEEAAEIIEQVGVTKAPVPRRKSVSSLN